LFIFAPRACITGNELADRAAATGRTDPTRARAPPAAGGPQAADADEETPSVTVIATATGDAAVKADLEQIASDAIVEKIKAAERDRLARAAAGTSTSRAAGQSVASRWIEARANGYVDPTSYGFDKARLAAMPCRTLHRCRVMQRPRNFKQRCPAPGCGGTVYNAVHGRGACGNAEMRGLITDCSNQSVHLIADAVAAGSLGHCALLVNAGNKYGSKNEDFTIPSWALPGIPGRRGFPDKPDMVQIENWQVGQPPPTNAKRTPGYTGPAVRFRIVEHKMANDLYLLDARNEKRSIYVELVLELTKAGWQVELCTSVTDPAASWYRPASVAPARAAPASGLPVVDATAHDDSDAESSSSDEDGNVDSAFTQQSTPPQSQECNQRSQQPARAPLRHIPLERGELRFPIHTIVIGHTGCHLESNKEALLALGVSPAAAVELLLALSVNALQRTHHCLVHYKRVCSAASSSGSVPASSAPSAGVG
jgi:hypothetical protein